jgi:hypothetical protein
MFIQSCIPYNAIRPKQSNVLCSIFRVCSKIILENNITVFNSLGAI